METNASYPIGKFERPDVITREDLSNWIETIARFPRNLEKEVSTLSPAQLDTPYRTDGWTVRQVVHHCADSHMNAFIRLKLTLTESNPVIKPYHQALWAELPDSAMPVEPSLNLLKGLHQRLSKLLESLDEEGLNRTYTHPEHGRQIPVREVAGMYAWHCNHHLAHITRLKQKNGWE